MRCGKVKRKQGRSSHQFCPATHHSPSPLFTPPVIVAVKVTKAYRLPHPNDVIGRVAISHVPTCGLFLRMTYIVVLHRNNHSMNCVTWDDTTANPLLVPCCVPSVPLTLVVLDELPLFTVSSRP